MKVSFITNNNQVVDFYEETSLLRVSIRYKAGMPFKCGGGMCKTCVCIIEEGMENTNKLTKKELNILSKDEIELSKNQHNEKIITSTISKSRT